MNELTLTEFMQTHPNSALESIAATYRVSLLEVIKASSNYHLLSGKHFDTVCQNVETWGDVTIIVNTPDIIFEFYGHMPSGKHGHGYYNLQGKEGLTGHIKAEHCQHIAFVERKFMGVDTASIIFLNHQGQGMFKIFVRRDELRNLDSTQLDAFHQLTQINEE